MRVLFTMSYSNIVLDIIPTLYKGYIVSVHRMVMENRPVDPGSIQGSHRPRCFIRIKHRTRANGFFFFVKLSIINHVVGLAHKTILSMKYRISTSNERV